MPAQIRYLDESKGIALQDVWSDIEMLRGMSKGERLGYPTQKPLALLKRIIEVSSNPGDIVLDPFCGCGTALVAAEQEGRRWIGIDITWPAIRVMEARLESVCGLTDVTIRGKPTEIEGARALAQSPDGRYQFQWWVVDELLGGVPAGGTRRKGADRGVDGRITFTDSKGELRTILISVKSGHVNSSMIRELKGTVEREQAAIGLFVTLEKPTREMKLEATTAGDFRSQAPAKPYPRIQILTIEDLLAGKKPDIPPSIVHINPLRPKDLQLSLFARG